MSDLQKIQIALSFISPDCDRDTWLKVGMALRDETDDFDLFDNWSAGGKGYNAKHTLAVWKSFRKGGVTIASLFGVAKDYGWTPEPGNKPSEEELAKQRAEAERRRLAREAEAAKAAAIAAERARALWEAAEPADDDSHPYLKKKGVKAHGLRIGRWEVVNAETGEVNLISKNALLIPICDRQKNIHSLQAIFSSKAIGGRDKDYLRDGTKSGNFHAIGKPAKHGDKLVFILAEGYATSASVYEAIGHCVLVCFDASNLVTVAKAIRERLPDAIILIAGDNDRWNRKPDGTPYNPGKKAADKAAEEAGALVALPPFTDADQAGTDDRGDPEGPTDWNDWSQLHGLESVASLITQVLDGGDITPPEPEGSDDAPEAAPWEESDIPGFEDLQAEDPAAPSASAQPDEEHESLQKNKYFTILGYDSNEYFLFSHVKKQVISFKKSDFSDLGLAEMAPTNWWEMNFPGNKGGVNRTAAFEWVITIAHARGIYDPSRIRGRGAWNDAGRAVFHHGSYLTVDGETMSIESIPSAYVYPMAKNIAEPYDVPLSAKEGQWLLSVAEMVRWSTQGSAALMAGWTMLAPICGALKWRPHIWITGGAGSGKTTVQRDFCAAMLNGVSAYYQGDSTEAGIRQDLKADALPVLIDEIESNDDAEKRRVAGVIALVRKSSSESQARTAKGTVTGDGQHYHVRSMFCLASINVNLPGKADIDRLTKLVIRVSGPGGEAHWSKLADELHRITADTTISRRLLARALQMMPKVQQCIQVFTKVAAQAFGTQRHGDQYGTLLAGCWCLTHDEVATPEQALAMIERYNWEEHTEDHDQDDALEALKAVTNAKIRLGGGLSDLTVYELVREASILHRVGDIEQKAADAALRRHGIRVEANVLLFGTSVPNLKTLLKDASCVTDIRGQLLRLPGATRYNDKAVKFNGVSSKCVAIPLDMVLDDEGQPPPADDDYPL